MAAKKSTKTTQTDTPSDDAKNIAKNDLGTSSLEGKTMDERMADLLKDHKKMGAR